MPSVEQFLQRNEEYGKTRAAAETEKNRRGDFSLQVKVNGQPVTAGSVSYRLKRIDFDFGCNIFMLNQHETSEMEQTWRAQWLDLFNTAVIPFYWEGTEPARGQLRYDADVPNDVYRRPPVDMTVRFCRAHGLRMKGHPLYWQEFVPEWLPEDWESLFPLIEKRFAEISQRYADQIPVFDVVNEPSRLWDQQYERKLSGRKYIFPPPDYLQQIFSLAERYFPRNTLILNETAIASFCDCRGVYSGFYQLADTLLRQGLRIDCLGLQCHASENPAYQNIYDADRLYGVLDTYAGLGVPLVLSEIGLGLNSEELQARAAEQLYRVCFSHPAMNGIFWWNLDDTGIHVDRRRNADGENLPTSGLVRAGVPKQAYKVLRRLIREEWTSTGSADIREGSASFRGYYGTYEMEIRTEGVCRTVELDFLRRGSSDVSLCI